MLFKLIYQHVNFNDRTKSSFSGADILSQTVNVNSTTKNQDKKNSQECLLKIIYSLMLQNNISILGLKLPLLVPTDRAI